ncbi:MAG: trehalose-phosphatase [Myxococcota bacterium]|nr:trehalose-phosphatase [Myxococcota bacterium]
MKLPDLAFVDDHVCIELARHEALTLMLDLDGTLIPFAATPEAAVLDQTALEILRLLQTTGVRVVIVSGRPRALVEPMRAGLDGIWWVAEHGSWRCLDGYWVGPSAAPEIPELLEVFAPFSVVPGARLESKSESLCVHWRLVPQALKEDLIAGCDLACEEWLETHPEFERLDGVEMLEVRRRTSNKGRAVALVREHIPGARIIAIGDDRTDDDMFAALRDDELAIGVGANRTRARRRLPDHVAVRSFLTWLHQARTSTEATPFRSLESKRSQRPTTTRLLIVSNRIPPVTEGRQRPVGGLVSALEPALRTHEGVWLGWSGGESETASKATIDEDSLPVRASFEFRPGWREHYYSGFCNRALWPLFHGFPGRVRYTDEDWLAYVAANNEFARHAFDLVSSDGTVWMHDYHLLLAGQSLRGRGFSGPIGLFLHIPFPHADLFDTLPWADELLTAMLDFDMIGFHTEQWAENFRACVRARGREKSMPEISVLPIGVDPLTFVVAPGTVDRDIVGLRAALGERKLILGVDRLDYSKGIPERLLAFERLLERSPEWLSKVSFVQVSVPSREEVPEYAELRRKVETLVGNINGRFGEADWVPVRYLYRSYDHRVLTQLYRLANVGLVTPLRDGLNLVAKEFVVSQDAADPGVLVLSRFAGAAAELKDAVLTNPFHPDGLACDIERALRMEPDERRRRHGLLSAALANKTPQRWAAAFLDRLGTTRVAC